MDLDQTLYSLSFDWVLKLLVFKGGGLNRPPPLNFICEKNNIMQYVDFFLSSSFEDMDIFHVFIYVSVIG